ncbi:hypothetical protein PRECH8_23880 [Insulibacter thermoxylanivorax]|uniref:LysM domain-containing protein n=1 Tax=Insulibacter thermoxylanivorax TaxID=2749268 RepID=A0A916QE66_9BACL|nr:LysM peptidoglycan-binding domain-containing protein [Insulibacter thermoxylanivorax]GFR39092.1 hypothetical protein PRECH8_23880 [Insulibacter thermoxylanivorax]
MSEQPKGLRFDIYERLTLSEDAAGIGELEDIELLPRITMQTHDDQAVLSGDLLLTGTYAGLGEHSGSQPLSHRIPVEITLPLKRIKRMDQIGIEIENFDVEVISDRSLNIIGVISLNGIDTSAEQTWQTSGEAILVYDASSPHAGPEHGAGAEQSTLEAASTASGSRLDPLDAAAPGRLKTPQAAAPAAAGDGTTAEGAGEEKQQAFLHGTEEGRVEKPAKPVEELKETKPAAPKEVIEEKVKEPAKAEAKEEKGKAEHEVVQEMKEEKAEPQVEAKADNQADLKFDAKSDMKTKDEADLISPQDQQALDAEHKTSAELLGEPAEKEGHSEDLMKREEQQEMKIAFGSNKQGADTWADSVQGVKSLLQSAPEEAQAQAQAAAEQAEEPVTAEEPRDNAVKWKNLLLSSEQDEQPFSKVRMCIVQKEETLDMIASRYSLNPKEIVLYNRLDSDRVYEGQVIYIPTYG